MAMCGTSDIAELYLSKSQGNMVNSDGGSYSLVPFEIPRVT